ncbi:MAG: 23S rRNA (adenine(2503)-C(2))-methyltransferase RlmN [Lentisphaeraceae bacterium]|nr:23S rRNA (adenine(2503)-C(2))-methyltransferase RlmN [Lentisphaeraceae bacterium]
MDSKRIDKIVEKYGLQNFRAKQLKKAFFEDYVSDYDQVSTLKKDLRDKLKEEEPILCMSEHVVQESSDKRTFKALLKLEDGRYIETVLMSPKPDHWTACISSQVGCAMACTFCATGSMGLLRNLTSEEISDQVLFWKQFIKKRNLDARLQNIVYMGMGEPFHNKTKVFESIGELNNPDTFNIGARHISVSTSGLLKPIYELAEKFPQVNLAISLHAANDKLRTDLMPINKSFPLDKLAEALTDYLATTNRKMFIEYILLDNDNDSLENAEELVQFVRKVQPQKLLHVNLIVYNQTDSHHRQASRDTATKFKDYLVDKGVSTTIRKNLGRDIDGACGQLAVHDQK